MDLKLQNALIEEIEKRNHCELICDETFRIVWLHDADYKIEFRYVVFLNRIIVSRICFRERRQGCMSACFEIIKQFADDLGYDIILLQSVETFEMMQWCKKMHFVPSRYNIDIEDEQSRNVYAGDYEFVIDESNKKNITRV